MRRTNFHTHQLLSKNWANVRLSKCTIAKKVIEGTNNTIGIVFIKAGERLSRGAIWCRNKCPTPPRFVGERQNLWGDVKICGGTNVCVPFCTVSRGIKVIFCDETKATIANYTHINNVSFLLHHYTRNKRNNVDL